jgi:Tol biopolymer transport system component
MKCNGTDAEIWVAHPDGTGDHRISTPGIQSEHPDFSRDGKWIAYDWFLPSSSAPAQIDVSAADGSNPHHLAFTCTPPSCLDYQRPAWSPDGRRLAITEDFGPFENNIPIATGIAILDLFSGNVTEVTKHRMTQGQDVYPRWSPDGQSLVFWRDRSCPAELQAAQCATSGYAYEAAIFIVRSDGTNLHQLTPWGEHAGDPDWSPDGQKIVYSTYPLSIDWPYQVDSQLVTIRPDGSGRTVLTTFGGPRETQPRWTPDGKAILYTKESYEPDFSRHTWVIAADGKSDVPVLTTRQICQRPVLQA